MTIVVTGGGSGGHITPILAVASELKRLQPDANLVYIGQRGEPLLDIAAENPNIDQVLTVRAGKFRRYHGEGWKQLFDVPTQAKNIRDAFLAALGIWQSFWLLGKLKPAVIFTRGGFVSVPVALAAGLRHIPYITHDSDSVPSLANRLIARRASLHAVALPPELYPYPADKTVMVGIPIGTDYVPVTASLKSEYRQAIGLDASEEVLLVTGGGNGADALNDAILANAVPLLKSFPKLAIVHFAGRSLETGVAKAYNALLSADDRKRVKVLGFTPDFYRYSGAADLIVARGGATNLAEFAAQAKACIIIPATQLVADHQTKNAEALAKRQAVVVLTQDQAEQDRRLASVVGDLLQDKHKRNQLSQHLAQFARTNAAERLAMLLLEQANKSPNK